MPVDVKMNQLRRVIGILCKLHVQSFFYVQSVNPSIQLVTNYISVLKYLITIDMQFYTKLGMVTPLFFL